MSYKIELKRKKILESLENRSIILKFVTIFLVFFTIFTVFRGYKIFWILVVLCGFMAYKFFMEKLRKEAQKLFDEALVENFFLDIARENSLLYFPTSLVVDVENSTLFDKKIERVEQNGTMCKNDYSFCFINCQIFTKDSFSPFVKKLRKLFKISEFVKIFDGAFISYNFKKFTETKLYILPNGEFPKNGVKKIEIGNENFSGLYSVFTNNNKFAQDVITDELMQNFIDICTNHTSPLYMEFADGKLYFKIEDNMFLASVFEPFREQNNIKNINYEIKFFFSIIEKMSSYDEIWSEIRVENVNNTLKFEPKKEKI